ncbi:hypothetical protein [Metasolibacillus sp.]|uniref:hypothetical protein n=1 Tax=Metasolibacillus sp. TaxID=2703680 RepID=UPI0025FE45E2|nr:hypothetical protein [Metasolibacillus sp.]MCT6925125.1 hypothetical protein [Metasolibacillus sp.]MCT6941329.1 hypothetical protein [Metasolibacillus sp.]
MENFITDFFTNKDNTLDITKVIFTLIGVMITAGISLIVALINNSRSKKTLFINTITNNRIEWMNNTKEMINHFIVLTEVNTHTPVKISGDSKFEYFNELSKTRNKILLHLNFKGYIDSKIIETINKIEYSIQVLADLLELYNSTDEDKRNFALKLYENELIKNNPKLFIENILNLDIDDAEKFRLKIEKLGGVDEVLKSIDDAVHEDILKHINQLNSNLIKEPRKINETINSLHDDLLLYTQVYMKVEWDRVKKESIGKLKEKEDKKFKERVDILIAEANRSTFNYSLNKLEEHYKEKKQEVSN